MHASSRFADFLSRLVVLTLMLAGVVAVFVWYFPLIRMNQDLREKIAVQDARIQQLQVDISSMTRQFRLYNGDSNTVERLLRENLGYARPGEYVIHFDGEQRAPNPSTIR